MKLTNFKALTFDCYGTLVDWETGMINGLASLVEKVDRPLSRNEILEAHAFYEAAHQRQTPAKRYPDVLATVYKRLAEEWGATFTNEECVAYGRSVYDWPAFPDSAEALAYLKDHFELVILSNVDNASFAASAVKLDVQFDAIYTAEDIGSYKPAQANFDYMLSMLQRRGLAKSDILHVAESMFHDHVPARANELATCWIYRRHDQEGFGATMRPDYKPDTDFTFHSMQQFADAHKAELALRNGHS